jgi:hypothetical protein
VTVKRSRLAVTLIALVLAVSALFGAALVPSANAAGVQVFRTDSEGYKTGTVFNFGNTGYNAYCIGAGIGAIGYGVAVCYL